MFPHCWFLVEDEEGRGRRRRKDKFDVSSMFPSFLFLSLSLSLNSFSQGPPPEETAGHAAKQQAGKNHNSFFLYLYILTAPQLLTSLLVLVSQPLLPGMPQLFQPLAHRHELGSVDWQTPWPEQGMPL